MYSFTRIVSSAMLILLLCSGSITVALAQETSCADLCGDVNDDGLWSITDLTAFVDFLFRNGDPPPPCR